MSFAATVACPPDQGPAAGRLPFLDRDQTVWILLAVAVGMGLGYLVLGVVPLLNRASVETTSIPIAIGCIAMVIVWNDLAKGDTDAIHAYVLIVAF